MGKKIVNQEYNNKTLISEIDDIIVIQLKENPTTGYRWHIRKFDNKIIKQNDDFFTPFKLGIGSGGERTFSFKPRKKGETNLQIDLNREWEEKKNFIDQFNLSIRIV